ncbi:hypothetical protein Fot_34184 [Forsythia ovata]|uniref:Uncharacterized protein n=1 Tax=Forsythia ovata TaxID=205694 RepID=A0ABD1SI51_9LAMI
MLLLSVWLFCLLQVARAQSPSSSTSDARALGCTPPRLCLSGICSSPDWVFAQFKEFEIPKGVLEEPYVERLVLVYQNLGNWSKVYYPLPGYTYVAPILGLLAYDASDLMANNLPELEIRASGQPISIKFSNLKSLPDGLVLKCVSFDLNGLENFSNVLSENICTTFQQGHFSIVVESIAPSPANVSPTPASPGGKHVPKINGKGKKNNSKVWIVIGSVLGGAASLVLVVLLVSWLHEYRHRKRIQQMERAADFGEILHMTTVGSTKAPAATMTRTQPTIETEYVP